MGYYEVAIVDHLCYGARLPGRFYGVPRLELLPKEGAHSLDGHSAALDDTWSFGFCTAPPAVQEQYVRHAPSEHRQRHELDIAIAGLGGAGTSIRATPLTGFGLAEDGIDGAIRVGGLNRPTSNEDMLGLIALAHRQPVEKVPVPLAVGTGGRQRAMRHPGLELMVAGGIARDGVE